MCLSIAVNRPGDVLAKGEHLGFEWVVTHNGMGYRCGYVRVPQGHPWHGCDYDGIGASVHGGLTFAEPDVPCDAPGPDTDWWVGFDCAHGFDAPDPELPISSESLFPSYSFSDAVIRTQLYAESECLSLCEQASAAVPDPKQLAAANDD